MPRASTPQTPQPERTQSASSAGSGRSVKRERDIGSKEKGKSAEDIGMYLDHFLEDVVDLPSELQVGSFMKSRLARSFAFLESSSLTLLQRKFKLIRELDEKCSENKGAIKEFHEGIMAGALKDSVLQETVKKMRVLHSECVTWGDEKMSLAIQAYDMVDNRIRQLDLDLRRFEQELATDPKFRESLDKLRCDNSGAKVGSGRKKKTTNVADLDVEVDPNEPLYCICRRVSFGEMIACDNEDCPIEWFHYACVGFKDAQKIPNSWRCPKCMNK
jgi:inhibitor of growth protein 4